MLRFTSCLFATVVVVAHNAHPRTGRIDGYHHLFLAVTVLSILFHTTRNPHIGIVDRLCAHAAFMFVVLVDTQRAIAQDHPWLLLFPVGVVCLWAAQSVWPARADALHAGLHVVTVVGVNCYIGFLV